jgi:NADH-quinone oxidoreductase subunit J
VAETIVFWIFAFIAVGGALLMVWAANPVYSVVGLMATLFSVAVFYVLNSGHLIAAVQVLVYAGAVMTLFLFVIMLIGVDKAEDTSENLPFQRQAALVSATVFAVVIIVAGSAAWVTGIVAGPAPNGTIEAISDRLFGDWVLPFEVTALLVIIAAAGTIALAQFRVKPREIEEPADDGPEEVETADDGEPIPDEVEA